MTPFPVRRILQIADIPPDGERIVIEAGEGERRALAEALRVPAVGAFTADLLAMPWGRRGAHVTGTVRGTVEQACVVTLEPVEQTIEEAIDVRFEPDAPAAARPGDLDVEIDPFGEDPPERAENGRVDLGALAAEHFALGIDPYPRRPGVAFDPAESGLPDEGPAEAGGQSPFEVLRRLKGGG